MKNDAHTLTIRTTGPGRKPADLLMRQAHRLRSLRVEDCRERQVLPAVHLEAGPKDGAVTLMGDFPHRLVGKHIVVRVLQIFYVLC